MGWYFVASLLVYVLLWCIVFLYCVWVYVFVVCLRCLFGLLLTLRLWVVVYLAYFLVSLTIVVLLFMVAFVLWFVLWTFGAVCELRLFAVFGTFCFCWVCCLVVLFAVLYGLGGFGIVGLCLGVCWMLVFWLFMVIWHLIVDCFCGCYCLLMLLVLAALVVCV